MDLRIGTSGYSYKEWQGDFYPEKIASGDMLAFYGERLSSVEINNTFYRLPRASVLETWAEAVPDDFRFVIKSSRRITHMKRLKDAGDETGYLMETLGALGPKLGAVLFQLPPNMKKDVDRLATFLDLIPGVPAAFEFRHETWIDDEVHTLLGERGCTLCQADTEEADVTDLVATSGRFGYVRLRKPHYDDDALSSWLERLRGQGWSEAFVFFKHEDGPTGPLMAMRLAELAKG